MKLLDLLSQECVFLAQGMICAPQRVQRLGHAFQRQLTGSAQIPEPRDLLFQTRCRVLDGLARTIEAFPIRGTMHQAI